MCPPPIDFNSIVHWILNTPLGISGVLFALLLFFAMRNSRTGRKWLLGLSIALSVTIFVINILLDVCHKIENKALSAKELAVEIARSAAVEIAEDWDALIGVLRRAEEWFDRRALNAKKNYA